MLDVPIFWPTFWSFVTRLGEMQILLPAALLAAWALLQAGPAGRGLLGAWLLPLVAAVLLTTASKVAFIGWGWGLPQMDFTGVSGHAMFAAAIYPLLAVALVPAPRRGLRVVALVAAALLALLVGVSRCRMGVHSESEVAAGLLLGAAVPLWAFARAGLAPGALRPWAPLLAGVWLVLTPLHAPASQSHALVTRLALALAGHQQPYLREPWLRAWQARHGRVL
jgi:membrane-associated phospholipid phosphatase